MNMLTGKGGKEKQQQQHSQCDEKNVAKVPHV